MQCVDKIRSAFTSGTDGDKGKAEEYYDPGRILPMVEAGFYTDNTNPKISFHGVPVPIISGQHKELPFGAPFGMGQIVDGDDLHWASSATALVGETVASTFSLSDWTNSPTQRMFIAMENTHDRTGPNMHMFIAPQANAVDYSSRYQTGDATSDVYAPLLWQIKSQDGGVNQEYSTSRHYNSGVTNIDDTKITTDSTSTTTGSKIYWDSAHPVSVDFDSWSARDSLSLIHI